MKSEAPYLPCVTADEMREVDRLMIEEFGIALLQMMELAGRNLGRFCIDYALKGESEAVSIGIMAGTGGNGGGAMVSARHLANRNAEVMVLLSKPESCFTGVVRHQLNILQKMGVSVREWTGDDTAQPFDLLIDGIIGYSLKGAPRGAVAEMIEWANEQPAPVVSLDLPCGLDATTGEVYTPCIRARYTLTLALPKAGFLKHETKDLTGDIYLADIGIPPQLYATPGLNLKVPNIFQKEDIIHLS